jgi:hypothetical protein
MVSVPVPPSAPKLDDELVTDGWHRVDDGAVAVTLVLAELPHATTHNALATINGRAAALNTPHLHARAAPATMKR